MSASVGESGQALPSLFGDLKIDVVVPRQSKQEYLAKRLEDPTTLEQEQEQLKIWKQKMFPQFKELPVELRLTIWKLAQSETPPRCRYIDIRFRDDSSWYPTCFRPDVIWVCREASDALTKHDEILRGTAPGFTGVPFNPTTDFLCFREPPREERIRTVGDNVQSFMSSIPADALDKVKNIVILANSSAGGMDRDLEYQLPKLTGLRQIVLGVGRSILPRSDQRHIMGLNFTCVSLYSSFQGVRAVNPGWVVPMGSLWAVIRLGPISKELKDLEKDKLEAVQSIYNIL